MEWTQNSQKVVNEKAVSLFPSKAWSTECPCDKPGVRTYLKHGRKIRKACRAMRRK